MYKKIFIGGAGLLLLAGATYVITRPVQRIDYAVAVPSTTPTPRPQPGATLLFVGDIMLARKVGEQTVAAGDWRHPFLKIADFLKSADITFANLENPVSTRGARVGSIYSFRADPRMLAGLVHGGIDVVSLANNHMWDYGRDALLDTMTNLDGQKISYVGAGRDATEAYRGITKVVQGVRITYLAYTDLYAAQAAATKTSPGLAIYSQVRMVQDIQTAKTSSDIVVVSFHTGTEYETTHNAAQELIFTTAINAGADLVVGHHPHVVQEVVRYKKGWIAYSLGNFIFDQNFSNETMEGLALKVSIVNKKISKVDAIKIGISSQAQAYLK